MTTTGNINFGAVADRLYELGYPKMPSNVQISVRDAEAHLREGIRYILGKDAAWSEVNYRPVVDWLTNNSGRGLLLAGGCGLGKSVIGMRVIPLLIYWQHRKIVSIYDARQLNQKIDEILAKHIIYIDDIGVESMVNSYGNKRIPFAELCDAAEKQGKLLMLSTNLSMTELEEKYGSRTIDRLRAITTPIVFRGSSLRH